MFLHYLIILLANPHNLAREFYYTNSTASVFKLFYKLLVLPQVDLVK
jgi:hypothetical protein